MSVRHVVAGASVAEGQTLDWRRIRAEIIAKQDKPLSVEERVTLLELFNVVMDTVARTLGRDHPAKADEFSKIHLANYRFMAVSEAMVRERSTAARNHNRAGDSCGPHASER